VELENEVIEAELKAMLEQLGITTSEQLPHKLAQMSSQQLRMALLLSAKEHAETKYILRIHQFAVLIASFALIALFLAFIFK
jgi:hypothetical protein